jgi:hypothetical protein
MRTIGYGAYGDTTHITEEQKRKILSFVGHTPNLSDRNFHKFAISLGLMPDDAEEVVYDFVRKNFKNGSIPLPPPPCPDCGEAHPHFIHTSEHGTRGAGRGLTTHPTEIYRMHMTPREMESMIYGPMFAELMQKRGLKPRKGGWEHCPSTPRSHLKNGQLGEIGSKKNIWKIIAIIAIIAFLFK